MDGLKNRATCVSTELIFNSIHTETRATSSFHMGMFMIKMNDKDISKLHVWATF